MYCPEDERSIANKLAREEKRQGEPEPQSAETTESKKDSTQPVSHSLEIWLDRDEVLIPIQARNHGNEPSKGAKIDQELKEEEAEAMKGKGSFGTKKN